MLQVFAKFIIFEEMLYQDQFFWNSINIITTLKKLKKKSSFYFRKKFQAQLSINYYYFMKEFQVQYSINFMEFQAIKIEIKNLIKRFFQVNCWLQRVFLVAQLVRFFLVEQVFKQGYFWVYLFQIFIKSQHQIFQQIKESQQAYLLLFISVIM